MKAKNFETLAYVPLSKYGFGILIVEAENPLYPGCKNERVITSTRHQAAYNAEKCQPNRLLYFHVNTHSLWIQPSDELSTKSAQLY